MPSNRKLIQTINDQFGLEDVGSTLLEDLAKGLYEPEEVVREYIQNAVDAHRLYLNLTGNQPEGSIQVEMRENLISILDYGIGMDFEEIKRVKSIAVSRKRAADIRLTGHKGVGIWAGLSFFETLKIYSTAKGSDRGYELCVDFKGIVQGISEEKNIGEVLNPNYSIEEYEEAEDEHYSIVTLENPVRSNEWFADEEKIKEAIRTICPCQVDPTFVFCSEVNSWYAKHNLELFPIELNGQAVYRSFPSAVERFEEGAITISDKEIAYYWRAIHKDNGKLSPNRDQIVGFQLIQDGFVLGRQNPYSANDKSYEQIKLTLNYLNWYIGEIHVVATGLRPNLRRNAFEESEDTRRFVKQLRSWYEELDHATRVYSYFRGKKKSYFEYDSFVDKLLITPMLWEDEKDRIKITEIETILLEDEEIAQKSKSRRANDKTVHPHEKEALSDKEIKANRKRILGKINELRKRDGAFKKPIDSTLGEKEPEKPQATTNPDEYPTSGDGDESPTKPDSSSGRQNDSNRWNEDEENGNEDIGQNTLIEVVISLLEQIMTEESLPLKSKSNIVKKLRERLLIVVGNEQESVS